MSANAGKVLLRPRGNYNASTSYEILDVVKYNHDSYVAKTSTTGHVPTDTAYWQPLTDGYGELEGLGLVARNGLVCAVFEAED